MYYKNDTKTLKLSKIITGLLKSSDLLYIYLYIYYQRFCYVVQIAQFYFEGIPVNLNTSPP